MKAKMKAQWHHFNHFVINVWTRAKLFLFNSIRHQQWL